MYQTISYSLIVYDKMTAMQHDIAIGSKGKGFQRGVGLGKEEEGSNHVADVQT